MDAYIFAYNTDIAIARLQVKALRFFSPETQITIVDNSTSKKASKKIMSLCNTMHMGYMQIERNDEATSSRHHALALDAIWKKIHAEKNDSKVLFLDHDIIPISPVTTEQFKDKDLVCWDYYEKMKKLYPDLKEKEYYLWPGLVYFDMQQITKPLETFQPAPGKDTGWQLKNLLTEKSDFFTMTEIEDGVTDIPFEMMSLNAVPLFVHMSKGSNWSKMPDSMYKKRKQAFIDFVQEKIGFVADKNDWAEMYDAVSPQIIPAHDPIKLLIERHFSSQPESAQEAKKTCFEIGCYPGRYLSVFGALGYQLNGLDYYSASSEKLTAWFNSLGYGHGDFYETDLFSFNTQKKYDVVCSFGFIEHFIDWKKVIDAHLGLVTEGGYVMITAPNFNNSLQKSIRTYVDRENLSRHHLPSIDIEQWEKYASEKGFSKVYAGYFGRFDFWYDSHEDRNWFKKCLLKMINFIPRIVRLPVNKLFASYCGVIFKKT
jgi:2-polyprenyl-3-methyl-5-hydroxy-6-metoxy-1,4-benzoquinol methylase